MGPLINQATARRQYRLACALVRIIENWEDKADYYPYDSKTDVMVKFASLYHSVVEAASQYRRDMEVTDLYHHRSLFKREGGYIKRLQRMNPVARTINVQAMAHARKHARILNSRRYMPSREDAA